VTQINLADNLSAVQKKILECATSSGRNVNDIRLIAVSKTRSLEDVKAIAELGQTCFGENTIQDAMSKIPYFNNADVEWHFIGHLQSKKAGKIPGYFQWVHSVDTVKLAQKLSVAMQARANGSSLNCLIQVNVSGEESKSGLLPSQVRNFLQQVLQLELPCIRWRGLMTIGVKADEQQTRHAFSQLKKLQEKCAIGFDMPEFDQLSMGMSGDYCIAIEEGATMIRVGTSIFGRRE
jgi:pyridoxal phosphate enzyme (YggS family)